MEHSYTMTLTEDELVLLIQCLHKDMMEKQNQPEKDERAFHRLTVGAQDNTVYPEWFVLRNRGHADN